MLYKFTINQRRDFVKRLILLLVILALAVSLISCNSKDDLNSELIEKVKILEENEYKFKMLNITYDEFISNTEYILSDNYNYMDYKSILVYKKDDNRFQYKGLDFKGVKIEELKQFKSEIEKIDTKDFRMGLDTYQIKISLSNVHDDITDKKTKVKVIYGQNISEIDSEFSTQVYTNRRYTFKKIDSDWKVIMIDEDSIAYATKRSNEEINLPNKELLSQLKYSILDGKEIEYPTVFYLKNE